MAASTDFSSGHDAPRKNPPVCILSGFADEIADGLDQQLATLEKLGVRHIEMRNVNGRNFTKYTPAEAREIKKQLDAAGVRLSAVGSPLGKIGIRDDFGPHMDTFKRTMELAQLMETSYIRMFSFFIPAGENPDDYKEAVLERWYQFQAYAKGSGIILLHENEKGIYGDHPGRCRTLLDAMDWDTVRGIFDPANFVQCKADTLEGFYLLEDKIVYMHIKDAVWETGRVVPSGQGDGHLEEILSRLFAKGFNGFLSLEPHLETGDIAVGGPEKFAIAHKALMEILDKLGVEAR